jgi:lipopolysaccharide export system permease protein
MRLLDRYLLREFLGPLGYCLGGFLIFWLVFLLFSELDEFQRHQLRALDIAQYLLLMLPEILGRVVPMALLLALLYTLTNHSRHNELTAMRCAGLSLWRLAVPYFLVSAICGLFLLLLNEILMPQSLNQAEDLLKKDEANQADQQWHRNLTFFSVVEGRTNVIGPFHFHLPTGEMAKPHILWMPTQGGRIEINAERGVYRDGYWHFYTVQQSVYRPGELVPARQFTNYVALPELKDPPRRIRTEIKISSLTDIKALRGMSLSLGEILEYQRWHPERRADPQLATKFHVRLAAPWTCLVVVLIALPFGAASGRRNVFVGVASSVFFCFAYIVMQRFGEAAGLAGKIAPWLAGWWPNILFGAFGSLLTFRVR